MALTIKDNDVNSNELTDQGFKCVLLVSEINGWNDYDVLVSEESFNKLFSGVPFKGELGSPMPVDKKDWIANQKNFNQSVADRIARQSSFPDTEEVLVEWTDFTRDEDGDVWAKMKILKGDEAVVKIRLEANMVMGRFIYDVEKDMVHVIGFDI